MIEKPTHFQASRTKTYQIYLLILPSLKSRFDELVNLCCITSSNQFSSINNMFTNISFSQKERCKIYSVFVHIATVIFLLVFTSITLGPFLFDDVGFDISFINLYIFVVVFDSVHLVYHLLFVPFSLMWLELSISVDV